MLILCVAMAQRMCFLLLVLSVSAVAADELSERPGQLVCPPDQDPLYSYWFTVSVPSNCQKSPTEECFYYLGVRRNPVNGSFADFYFVAKTQGYVAVGFSKDSLMGEDDVIGCKRDPQTGTIRVVSAWNPAHSMLLTEGTPVNVVCASISLAIVMVEFSVDSAATLHLLILVVITI